MANELVMDHTIVLNKIQKAYNDKYRIILLQGGARSSKTYSTLQMLIIIALTEPKTTISIVRKTFPSLRATAMRDFMDMLMSYGLYNPKLHNKTNNEIKFPNGSLIEFFSLDDSVKVRGRKRHILYANEGNELEFEEYQQLAMRTERTIIIDFNPSDSTHFLYDIANNDNRAILIKSTYKDNQFLAKSLVEEIEGLINVDENYYRIYALGEAPTKTTKIYSHFKEYTRLPNIVEEIMGLDFGFRHQMALVRVQYAEDGKIYVKEELYAEGLTPDDLVERLRPIITNGEKVYCDSARPDIIEQLRRGGYNVYTSNKSVLAGINYIKSRQIYIHKDSVNLWKEVRLYSWKSKGDIIYEEPIKLNDDLLDGMRYSIYTHNKDILQPPAMLDIDIDWYQDKPTMGSFWDGYDNWSPLDV